MLRSEGLIGTGIHNNWKWARPTKDPEYKIRSAVVTRLAREVWLAADSTKGNKGPQKDSLTPLELSSLFHIIGQAQQSHTTTGSSILDWITEALDHFAIRVKGPTIWKISEDAFDATITTKFNLNKAITRVWEDKLVQHIGIQSGGTQTDMSTIHT